MSWSSEPDPIRKHGTTLWRGDLHKAQPRPVLRAMLLLFQQVATLAAQTPKALSCGVASVCLRVAAMRVFARLLVARHGPPLALHAGFLQSKPFVPLLVLGLSAGYPPRRISQPRVCSALPLCGSLSVCLSVSLSLSLSLSLFSRNVQTGVHSDPNFGPCSSPWSGNL